MTGTGTDAHAALLARAEAQAARRELPQAIASYEAALRMRPGDPDVLVQLSYLHSLSGHYRAGREHARQAAACDPIPPRVLAELLPRLRTFNAVPELIECTRRLRPLSRVPIPLLVAVAAQLSYLNLSNQAIGFLDEARRGDPDYPATLLARAQVLIYLGRFDEAGADIARALRRAPEIAHAYWLRSQFAARSPSAASADAIRAQLARPGRTPADIALLGFALHAELDALGDHAGAWDALALGCRAKRSTLRHAPAESVALVDALCNWSTEAAPPPGPQAPGSVPVFIVGMHRSGTTLLEQLLDGSPQVHATGELYDFTSAMRNATDHHCRGVIDATIVERARGLDFAAVGRDYLAGVAWRLRGEAFFTDKLPSNFLNLGFICRALPQARILHMVRDPVETCFSNLRELFSDANAYSYDQLELAGHYRQYRRLMAHWQQAWPGRILDVDYARLVREPEAVMRQVAAFCGLPFDPAMLAHRARARGVATASAVQVRGEVSARERPKWEPYRAYLRPLIGALAG
ncbi:MAG TPA: sulfotransferase [Luteimonas sp.]|nr:sulfotransferase [Luteimonas sp.]